MQLEIDYIYSVDSERMPFFVWLALGALRGWHVRQGVNASDNVKLSSAPAFSYYAGHFLKLFDFVRHC